METDKLIKQAHISRDFQAANTAKNNLQDIRSKIRNLKTSQSQIIVKQHLIIAYNSLESMSAVCNWTISNQPNLSELIRTKAYFDDYRSVISDADLLVPE